jgi:hypothetical protein
LKYLENRGFNNISSNNDLVLGWEVTAGMEPISWLQSDVKPGEYEIYELITVPAIEIGHHTVIIGQSGSRKSFLLGRLIEEILLKTKANCVILDPNSDFGVIHNIDDTVREQPKYNATNRRGKLSHETTEVEFTTKWSVVPKSIYTMNEKWLVSTEPYKPIRIWWPSLSLELIFGEQSPSIGIQLQRCHEFVSAICCLSLLDVRKDGIPIHRQLEPLT